MFFSFEVLLDFLSYMILGVGYISHSNLFPEPLDIEEEKIYLEKMKNGDTNAKKVLIERNLRLVAHVAKKYQTTNVEQDDLISIGTIGLIKGINSFNIEKNYKLATYVARCIENEILMHLRANKKYALDMYLNEPIGKDKDDNIVTLQEVIEIEEKNVEDEIDFKFKVKEMEHSSTNLWVEVDGATLSTPLVVEMLNELYKENKILKGKNNQLNKELAYLYEKYERW